MTSTRKTARTSLVVAAVAALVLTGCSGDDDEPTESAAPSDTAATTDATTEAMEPTESALATEAAGGEVATGRGVTAEPCPDGNPDRGCIYLGIISDLSVGPFAPLGVPITESQTTFWNTVNENGGIGGAYDVNVTENTQDAQYNPQIHAEEYEKVRGEVLALAQSLGTSQSLSVIDAMREDHMVAVPMTWWSGWDFDPNILQSGSSYCVQGMNGIDYVKDAIETVSIVKFPGDYGEDWAAGVRIAAEAAGVEVLGEDITQVPISAGGDVAAAVGELATANPDAVFLAVGPTELGQISGGLAQQGYEGRYVGANPSYNGALLDSPVGPILEASYIVMGPFAPYDADDDAHAALQTAIPEPTNEGVTYGWMMSYALLDVLNTAYEAGDLTPEGVEAAATTTVVSYEGALPDLDLSGSPADQSVRGNSIAAPSADGATGLALVEDSFTGDVAANHPFDEPCFDLS